MTKEKMGGLRIIKQVLRGLDAQGNLVIVQLLSLCDYLPDAKARILRNYPEVVRFEVIED